MARLRLRLSVAAQDDIADLLAWTARRFGARARARYAALLAAALADLAADPARPASAPRPELGAGVRSYHLRHSRKRGRTEDAPVGRPRHVVLYRTDPAGTVEVGRILYDAMELERHLPFVRPDDD